MKIIIGILLILISLAGIIYAGNILISLLDKIIHDYGEIRRNSN